MAGWEVSSLADELISEKRSRLRQRAKYNHTILLPADGWQRVDGKAGCGFGEGEEGAAGQGAVDQAHQAAARVAAGEFDRRF
jgi:hypothetical protein